MQGLADVFIKLRLPWDSEGAARLNKDIFETIYFAALSASKDIAKVDGPYSSYQGSPVSKGILPICSNLSCCCATKLLIPFSSLSSFSSFPSGILQYDMWGVTPSDRWDWAALKAEIAKHGVRNSLLVAPMPTASTSQILGNNECFEPYTTNIYTRRVLAGTTPYPIS